MKLSHFDAKNDHDQQQEEKMAHHLILRAMSRRDHPAGFSIFGRTG